MENDINNLPWYMKHYVELLEKDPSELCDDDAREFNRDFLPLYIKYAGTKSLMKHLRNYLDTHDVRRKDDLRFQLVCMWCWHVQYYRERRGQEFKAEDVFKIKIPKIILDIKDER